MAYKNLQTLRFISDYLKLTKASPEIIQDIDTEIERMEDTGEYHTDINKNRERISLDNIRSICFATDVVIFYADNPDKITSVTIANMLGIPAFWSNIKTHMTSLRKKGILDPFNTSKATKDSKKGVYTYNPDNLPDVVYISSLLDDATGEPTYYVLNANSPLREENATEDTRTKLTHYQLLNNGYIPVVSKSTGSIIKYVHKKYIIPEGFSLA